MTIFKKAEDLRRFLTVSTDRNSKTGFVPTMGALHQGHASLVQESKKQDDVTICSIFVNPVQFNDPSDYEKYPVTPEKDILLLEQEGCDILFMPSLSEIYPQGPRQDKHYDLGHLETIFEGKYRPGHFQAVCMIMEKLLAIVKPDNLYMGRKDYQQCMVIRHLLALLQWNSATSLNVCPTLREENGLAMSSRNLRLTNDERKKANAIFKSLEFMRNNLRPGATADLKKQVSDDLQSKGFRTDYAEIADASTLEIIDQWDGKTKVVGLIAAFLNEVRLIDNMQLN